MADREPFAQRMDPELYGRVEARADELGRTKASVFDEMMRDWLDRETTTLREELEILKRRQSMILSRLDEPKKRERTEGNRRDRSGSSTGPTVTRLADYDPGLPEEYTLSKAALGDVPDSIDDEGFEINPAHLDIDRYPKPVRVKRCLPVAVLRYENETTVTGTEVRDTIQRVLGTERYASRYYSNVVRYLRELPGDENDEFSVTETGGRDSP